MQEAIAADNDTENVKATPIDVTPHEPENLSDLLGAQTEEAEQSKNTMPAEKDEAPDFVDPETGEIKASDGNLFDNLADL